MTSLKSKLQNFDPPEILLSRCIKAVIDYAWISKLLRPRELSCWLKKTYFGEFGYLNRSCIKKSIILMLLSPSRDKFTFLLQNSVTDVSVDFRPLCCYPSGCARKHGVSIQISVNLGYKFFRISRLWETAVTWILARVFVYLPSFFPQILDSIYWMVLIFISIFFEWRDTENQYLFQLEW